MRDSNIPSRAQMGHLQHGRLDESTTIYLCTPFIHSCSGIFGITSNNSTPCSVPKCTSPVDCIDPIAAVLSIAELDPFPMAVTGVFIYLVAVFGTWKLLLTCTEITKPFLAWITALGVVTTVNYAWAMACYHHDSPLPLQHAHSCVSSIHSTHDDDTMSSRDLVLLWA